LLCLFHPPTAHIPNETPGSSFRFFQEKVFTCTTPCREKPRLAQPDARLFVLPGVPLLRLSWTSSNEWRQRMPPTVHRQLCLLSRQHFICNKDQEIYFCLAVSLHQAELDAIRRVASTHASHLTSPALSSHSESFHESGAASHRSSLHESGTATHRATLDHSLSSTRVMAELQNSLTFGARSTAQTPPMVCPDSKAFTNRTTMVHVLSSPSGHVKLCIC
jgi:hypothetical protein